MDYREELLNKIMIGLCNIGIEEDLNLIKEVVVRSIGDYEINERCTEIVTVDDDNIRMIKLFFATKKTEGCSDATAKNRWSIYKRFCADVNKPFNEINVFDIRLWLAKEQQRISLHTVDSYRISLTTLFTWLYTEGMITSNPMTNIKPIKHPNVIKKAFNSVEVDALKSACKNKKERAMIELLLSSGLRCKELCNLKWDDINFVTKDVTVVQGKGNKNRITMMDDVTRKYLLEYKNDLNYNGEYVFAVKYNNKIKARTTDSVWRQLKSIGNRAKVSEVNPHKFRHTFATIAYKRGMDIHMIQRLLGHANINTTMIYIDSDIDLLRNAYKCCE